MPDAGIDVASKDAVAQVKMEGILTGRPIVQALFGVATAEGKRGLFFSLAGYTPWQSNGQIEWESRSLRSIIKVSPLPSTPQLLSSCERHLARFARPHCDVAHRCRVEGTS